VALHISDPDATLEPGDARLFDAAGRLVATLSGTETVRIPGDVAAGQYYIAFRTRDGARVTKRITVLR
jgi:hypothetical protein